MRLKLQMQNLIHSLDSNFTNCACGQKAHGCALKLMESFVDMVPSRFPEPQSYPFPTQPHRPIRPHPHPNASPILHSPSVPNSYPNTPTPNTHPASLQALQLQSFARRHLHLNPENDSLGPLVGTSRGFRTRVVGGANAGGMNGVESVSANVYDGDHQLSNADEILLQNKYKVNGVPAPSKVTMNSKTKSNNRRDGKKSADRALAPQSHLFEAPQIHLQIPSPRKTRSKSRSSHVSPVGSENRSDMIDESAGSKLISEESMPPKMRKKWIRQSSEALKETNGNGSGSSSGNDPSTSGTGNGNASGMSTPTTENDITEKGGFLFQKRISDARMQQAESGECYFLSFSTMC